MLGRLRRPADFKAVLATPAMTRSAHFAAHHLPRPPRQPGGAGHKAHPQELSTRDPEVFEQAVDELAIAAPEGWWIGFVVPKRHARRATTRNLIRRQMRRAVERHHARLARGIWILRLRAAVDARRYQSAASTALRCAVRAELDGLLRRAAA